MQNFLKECSTSFMEFSIKLLAPHLHFCVGSFLIFPEGINKWFSDNKQDLFYTHMGHNQFIDWDID